MVFLARECGWTKEYIADNLTLSQIQLFCEKIQVQKMQDARLQAIVIFNATATAFGSVKNEQFQEFLEILSGVKKDINEVLDELKNKGLPVEDHG